VSGPPRDLEQDMASLPEPILVLGATGYRNVGDEAILGGLLTELGDRRITVVSRRPQATTAIHRVRAIGLAEAPVALERHRSLVIGGGGLFGPDLGLLGRLIGPFGLWASWRGLDVAIVGVGVDAKLPRVAATALRRLLPRSRFVGVRDEASAAIVRSLGGSAVVEPDLGTRLQPASPDDAATLLARVGLDLERPIVGLALAGLHSDAAGGEDRLIEAIAEAIRRLPKVQFVALPMSRHPFRPAQDDVGLAVRLGAACPSVAVVEQLDDPRVALAAFGRLDAALCMRYHSLVFAERWGVPLVALPYAPKCRTWLEEHGVAPTPADPDMLVAALERALVERARRGRTAA
jgi:polysaccharide pyruvyl transferase WcaK-like protein